MGVMENRTLVADEMFNNSAVWMGDWKAIRHEPPVGDGKSPTGQYHK